MLVYQRVFNPQFCGVKWSNHVEKSPSVSAIYPKFCGDLIFSGWNSVISPNSLEGVFSRWQFSRRGSSDRESGKAVCKQCLKTSVLHRPKMTQAMYGNVTYLILQWATCESSTWNLQTSTTSRIFPLLFLRQSCCPEKQPVATSLWRRSDAENSAVAMRNII